MSSANRLRRFKLPCELKGALLEQPAKHIDQIVLLAELAQNADDPLSQASEIASAPLPPTARRLLVRVHVQDGVTTIDVRHHGRPINDNTALMPS
jgi:hypothetical protein